MNRRGYLAQLALVWAIGSLTMGTVAVLLISERGLFRNLTQLSGLEFLALVALFGLLLGLLVTAWRAPQVSWLTGDTRARVLWALLVAGLLLRPWRANAAAAALTLVALGSGVLVAGVSLFPLLGYYFMFLQAMFGMGIVGA